VNEKDALDALFAVDARLVAATEIPPRLVVPAAAAYWGLYNSRSIDQTDMLRLLTNFAHSLQPIERTIRVKYAGGEFECTFSELVSALNAVENE